DHGFERLSLVLHVALRGLDQVRDQVVAAGQLDIDLGERVLVRVAASDEAVVEADRIQRGANQDDQENERAHRVSPSSCARAGRWRLRLPGIARRWRGSRTAVPYC